MANPELIRSLLLLIPLTATALLLVVQRPNIHQTAAIILSFLWLLPTLLGLNLLASVQGWWRFNAENHLLLGVPVDILLGWAFAWGPVVFFALSKTNFFIVLLSVLWLDVALMPQLAPVIELGSDWLVGEAVVLLVGLLPAQLLARWTAEDIALYLRTTLQAFCFAGLFLFFVPTIVLEQTGESWQSVLQTPSWLAGFYLQGLAIPLVMGLSAAQEFAQRGGGTPIPLDPPKRLVTSGAYAYLANPMQFATALLWLGLGFWLHSVPVAAGSLMVVIYGLGIGDWQEKKDLPAQLGPGWEIYRKEVRNWWPRWRPYVPLPARIYVAEGCSLCEEIGRWILGRKPVGLQVVAAQDHPERDLPRITYAPGDGSPEEEGVVAIARALEHVHLGWAWIGWAVRLPVMRQLVQLLADAVGEKPMERCPRRG